jgi:MFS family permease
VGLHASPLEFSILGMLGFLPFILFALPAGVWVDRLRRRPILIAGDLARAALLVLIPVLWAFGALRMWQLLVLQFAIGIFTVFFDVAYQSYLPALVDREELIDGNSKLQLTVSLAQVAGPSASGGLIAAITAPYAVALDAASFVISAIFMLRIRKPETVPERAEGAPKPKMWPEVKEGVRWVAGHRWLRAIAACTGSSNFFTTISFSIALLYLTRSLHLSAVEVGVVFGVGSVGSIAGALTANRIQRAIGVGRTILIPTMLASLAMLAYPLAPRSFPLPVLIAGQAVFGFGAVAYNITQVSLRQAITPERLQGRMNAAMRWIVWGTIPLGMIAGGSIATAYGLRAALWVGAIGSLFTFLPVALSSVRSIRELPEPRPDPALSIEPLIRATVEADA